MSTPHSGAPTGPDVKRAALGGEAARGSAVAVGTVDRTLPNQGTQRLALPEGALRLLEKRNRKLAPIGNLFVALGRNLGKHYDWRIGIGVDDDPDALDFTVAAGLSIIIGGRDQARIDQVARAVVRFRPRRMVVANYSQRVISPAIS